MKLLAVITVVGSGLCASGLAQTGWTVQNSGVSSVLYTVKAVDENICWAAGLGGTVIRTTNGGTSWETVGNSTIPDIYNIEAIDQDIALVAATTPQSGGNAYIYRTSNGGASWERVYELIASGAYMNCIKMYDQDYGIAIGDPVDGKWVVLKTTNGGRAWARLPNEPTQIGSEVGVFHILSLISPTEIRFTAGTSGTRMYKSTDAGATWSHTPLPFSANSYALSLWFNDTNLGVAGSSSSSVPIARTTDGGESWIPASLPSGGTWGLAGYGNTFFAVNWYSVYRSNDSGATWSPSYEPNIGQLVDVSFIRGPGMIRGWVIGGLGFIATYYEQTTSIEIEEGSNGPSGWKLFQNYPNPFNPSTTIKFSVEVPSHTRLNVWNILGQHVATLFDEVAEPGRYYRVNFDASGVASGVYIYSLQSGLKRDLKKLVVLK